MIVVNLTAHPVTVFGANGDILARWPPGQDVARRVEVLSDPAYLDSDQGPVPTVNLSYAPRVEGLPEPQAGVVYIVSRVTAAAVERDDLFFPADEVRDEQGRIAGCRVLGRFVHTSEEGP